MFYLEHLLKHGAYLCSKRAKDNQPARNTFNCSVIKVSRISSGVKNQRIVIFSPGKGGGGIKWGGGIMSRKSLNRKVKISEEGTNKTNKREHPLRNQTSAA